MGAHSGPNIVNDGLVFQYDMNNTVKSWKGKPLTNYYPDIFTSQSMRTHTKHFWNGKYWIIDGTYSDPGIPGPEGVFLGKVAKHVSGSLNTTFNGNSYGYMLRDISDQTIGEYYSQSCYIYVSENCDITAIPSTIEQESTGEAVVLSGEAAEYDMNNKGTWQRIAKRAISDGTVRYIPLYPRKEGITDGVFSGFFMWGGVQVEDGSSVSPIVPADDGVAARSTTEALLDISGQNNTVTASSLTYNSDGSFEFDRTQSDFINISDTGYPTSWSDPYSFEAVIYVPSGELWYDNTVSNSGTVIVGRGGYAGSQMLIRTPTDNVISFWRRSDTVNSSTTATIERDKYYHVVGTYDGSGVGRIYLNGVFQNSNTGGTDGVPDTGSIRIGGGLAAGGNTGGYASGRYPMVRIYQKQLTDAEVKQNFEATRGLYGI